MFRSIRDLRLFSLLGLVAFVTSPVIAKENSAVIEEDKQVSFTYTLSVDGDVVESNDGKDPLVYIQGGGQILPALESEMAGLTVGDKKTVNLNAADAYGEIDENAVQEVPVEQLPEGARTVGSVLQAQGFPGRKPEFSEKGRTSVLTSRAEK